MAIVITVAGQDRTGEVTFNTFQKTDNLYQQVDNCTFSVRRVAGDGGFVPEVGQEIVVTKDGTKIFGGVVVRVDQSVAAQSTISHAVTCNDYSHYLRRRLVTERYSAMTVNAIVADILSGYAGSFTDANVNCDIELDSVAFDKLSVAECLERLAKLVSYSWYVDYDRDVHFFAKGTEAAPFPLSDVSGGFIYDSLQVRSDLSQVRNRVTVRGGSAVSTSNKTEYWSGDTTRTIFPLATKFAEEPTVTVGGVGKTVGIEGVDEDASFQAMWDYNQKSLRFTAGNTPGSGTNNIVITGIYEYPILVRVPSTASIFEYGTYDHQVTDESIKTQGEAVERAKAELAAYQFPQEQGSFTTYEDGLRSGQTLLISSANRDLNLEVVVQSVTARMRDPLGDSFEYEVRFSTLRSMGIVAFFQEQLRSRRLTIDQAETVLGLREMSDTLNLTVDGVDVATPTSPPYYYGG